ncbi:major vault protein-like [Corticium candelabrum]|uniref:major vault protein-like n=1 Tax=Corticium candelabrum TaxID=121492 RepID=UPI002E2551E1|nr:major vault protein-like [Corticium candelabrum]
MSSDRKVIGLKPLEYVHILDINTNVTGVEVGPQSVSLLENQRLVAGPLRFVIVPPGHYCVVQDPIDRSKLEAGKTPPQQFGWREVRFHGEPFPLYPGEILQDAASAGNYAKALKLLPVVKANHAIRLRAAVDHDDSSGERRCAGDMWQLEGPLTYCPTPEVDIETILAPEVILPGHALRLRARERFTAKDGVVRVTGEEWLVRDEGAYLPDVFEEVLGLEKAYTLTLDAALHMRAMITGEDANGKERKAGDEWLVTLDEAETYIPDVWEVVVTVVKRTVLNSLQYCVVLDPIGDDGKNKLGMKELRKGPVHFFLHPGEKLERDIQKSYILGDDEALVLVATEEFVDESSGDEIQHSAGDRWMIQGPTSYVPPVEVTVAKMRKAIPLNKNEGVYVQNIQTGEVRSVMGPQSYLLQEYEELFEKQLPDDVEEMLKVGGGIGDASIRKVAYFESSIDAAYTKKRDKTRVVTYRCPNNSAVQVYNYQKRAARVTFGPDMVMLDPHENFNVLSLSAGKPKKEHALRSLALMLGPDFITDIIDVETSDHARLRAVVSFNNYFEANKGDKEEEAKLFSVPDFIGFACRDIGSRIRSAVAQTPFDDFHRHSARIIRVSVFGLDDHGKVKSELRYPSNNLVITNIDIQSIEPVDRQMRESLSKSVQMAIEIATQSIEAQAAHEAKRHEQVARGHLDRQKLANEIAAEKARMELYELQAVSAAVESTGQAKAEAQAEAEKLLIEGESEIEAAKLKAEAEDIEQKAELESQMKSRADELSYLRQMNELEIQKKRDMANIEVEKFKQSTEALGSDTIAAIAQAGPESNLRMLKALGITTTLITDGKSPINLFGTASGLIGAVGKEDDS